MVISSCVRIFHAYQLKIVFFTDCILLPIPVFYHFIVKMLFSVKLYCQNGYFRFSKFLTYYKIKPPIIEKIIIAFIILENMRNLNFFMYGITALCHPDIFQCVIKIFQKSFLSSTTKGLYAQGSGGCLFGCHLRSSV